MTSQGNEVEICEGSTIQRKVLYLEGSVEVNVVILSKCLGDMLIKALGI
jgi:hypothetical protein